MSYRAASAGQTLTVRWLQEAGTGEVDGAAALQGNQNPAPVAEFSADVVVGTAPLAVSFSDQSTGAVEGWDWDFGDGASRSVQSPGHTYSVPGTYSVTLKVTGPGGTAAR